MPKRKIRIGQCDRCVVSKAKCHTVRLDASEQPREMTRSNVLERCDKGHALALGSFP
jgi:hypothetical protein